MLYSYSVALRPILATFVLTVIFVRISSLVRLRKDVSEALYTVLADFVHRYIVV